jgi:hypothetical protein
MSNGRILVLILSESPKERHGVKTKPKNLISVTPKGNKKSDEEPKKLDKGKNVEVHGTSTLDKSVTTTDATKVDEVEVVK